MLKWYSGFKLGQIWKKYKLDTIYFTNFILEDPVTVFGRNCIIADQLPIFCGSFNFRVRGNKLGQVFHS